MQQLSPEDQQYIEDLNLAWLEKRYGKFSGSNMISLMGGIDDPVLLSDDKIEIVLSVVDSLDKKSFGKTGKPYIKDVRANIAGFDIDADQLNYALKQLDPYSEGLKTYAEKVAIQSITKFTPDPELTKPWIVRGKEYEALGVQTLSNVLDMDFVELGHDQVFTLHPEYDDYGVTADGLNKEGGKTKLTLEGKCPDTATHLKYTHIKDSKTLKEIEPKYFWQTQAQMDCHEVDKGLFFSFDDRFDEEHSHLNLHFCYLDRDDKAIKQIHERLNMAREWQDKFLNDYANLKGKTYGS